MELQQLTPRVSPLKQSQLGGLMIRLESNAAYGRIGLSHSYRWVYLIFTPSWESVRGQSSNDGQSHILGSFTGGWRRSVRERDALRLSRCQLTHPRLRGIFVLSHLIIIIIISCALLSDDHQQGRRLQVNSHYFVSCGLSHVDESLSWPLFGLLPRPGKRQLHRGLERKVFVFRSRDSVLGALCMIF